MFPPFLMLMVVIYSGGRMMLISVQSEIRTTELKSRWHRVSLEAERRYNHFGRQPGQSLVQQELVQSNTAVSLMDTGFTGTLINANWQKQVDVMAGDWRRLQQMIKDAEEQYRIKNRLRLRTLLSELEVLKLRSIAKMEAFTSGNRERIEIIGILHISLTIVITLYLIVFGILFSEKRVRGRMKLHDRIAEANRELTRQNANLQNEIKERRIMEVRLKESEARYRVLVESMANGLVLVDGEERILYINPSMQGMTGYSLEEVRGRKLEDMLPESIRTAFMDNINQVYAGNSDRFEIELTTKEDDIRSVLVIPKNVYDENGAEIAAFTIFTDISRFKNAEKELQESKQMLEHVINTIPQFIFWKNTRMEYEGCNVKFANAAGYREPSEVIGKTDRDMCWTPEESDEYAVKNEHVLKNGTPVNTIHQQTQADGRTLTIDAHRVPLFDTNGNVIGVLGAYEDITEKLAAKKLEQEREKQLIQADKMISLGILVTGVAHELNNPNQFIISHIEPLKRAWDGATPILEKYYDEFGDFRIGGLTYLRLKKRLPDIFNNITEGTRRINSIVNELKEFAREKPADQLESIQVNSIVQSALTLSSNLIKKSTDHFSVDYGRDLPLITGHYQRLEQVVINLVQNACQALTDKNEAISIQTGYDKEQSVITVEIVDEGAGVEPEQIKHMTDPFYTTKRDTGGSGLGLAISSNIILNHGGKLVFRPGKERGLSACFTLPADSADGNKV